MDVDDKLKQAIALGREHYEKREYDKAEHFLLKVIAQGGNRFADVRVKLAGVYRQMNDLPAARYELEEALRVRPRFSPARVAMGVLLLVSGQRQKALDQWEEVLRAEPENKAAQMYLRMARHPSP